jgi:hypothetical protein
MADSSDVNGQPSSASRGNAALRRVLGEPGQVAGNIALLAAALFALAWAVARAHVQAMTGDEGVTFEIWVLRYDPFQWTPANNNHILNSLLMRLITSVFGVSHLSVRAPALIGAAVYIAVSLWLSKLVNSKWYVRLILFLCLVYNPFIFDFMVAARGYGMGTAFLLCAIAGPAWCYLNPANGHPKKILRVCALSSALLALSFTAIFPFAFVVAASWLILAVWGLRSAADHRLGVVAACTIPGLIVILLLPAHTLLHWNGQESLGGTTSIIRTIETVAQASLYRLNPHILNPLLFPIFMKLKRFLIPGIVGLVLLHSLLVFHGRAKLNPRNGRLFALGVAMAGIAILSLVFHLVSFLLFGLELPQDRYAIFLVPLCTLAAGMIAAVPLPSRTGRACRGALFGVLSLLAFHYIMCLRLTYFREWQYQEDVKRVYDVVAWYNHNRGVRDAEVSWAYDGALAFYRDMSGRETLLPFTNHFAQDKSKDLYVLSGEDSQFIAASRLKVVYRGPSTDVVVAVRPEFGGGENAPSSLAILP